VWCRKASLPGQGLVKSKIALRKAAGVSSAENGKPDGLGEIKTSDTTAPHGLFPETKVAGQPGPLHRLLRHRASRGKIGGVMNAFAVLNSLFDPSRPSFTKEGVQTLLGLKCSDAELARMENLAEKANQGTLNAEERREYDIWVRAGTFISMLQAKARLYQKKLAAQE
jgi:hypothetical protein